MALTGASFEINRISMYLLALTLNVHENYEIANLSPTTPPNEVTEGTMKRSPYVDCQRDMSGIFASVHKHSSFDNASLLYHFLADLDSICFIW